MSVATAAVRAGRRRISTIGFSGAGFMTSYHFGAASCLQKYGILPQPGEISTDDFPHVTGVSGGAITASAIMAGITPEEGMQDLKESSRRTRLAGGMMDGLIPGFSLIDQAEELMLEAFKKVDQDLFFRRIEGGRKLRIGLTERRRFYSPESYVYVDQYRDTDDVVAACILSSYVPFLTGPLWGALKSSLHQNMAVQRANKRLLEMTDLGFVKHGITGETFSVHQSSKESEREAYWDGGLIEMFPIFDNDTLIVSPLSGSFGENPAICPLDSSGRSLKFTPRASIHASMDNVSVLRRISFSSDEMVLQECFNRGFTDAQRFLIRSGHISPKESKATTYGSNSEPAPELVGGRDQNASQ